MQTPSPSTSRKRPRPDEHAREEQSGHGELKSGRAAAHALHPAANAAPRRRLPTPPLDREALRDLRQELSQAARASRAKDRLQPRRHATRHVVADWRRRNRPPEPAAAYLESRSYQQYRALQNYAKHGGPDLRDIRGCRKSALAMSGDPMAVTAASSANRPSAKTMITTEGGSGRSISPYNRKFEQRLIDGRVYPPVWTDQFGKLQPEPENLDAILERLARPRRSLSPTKFTKEHHAALVKKSAHAAKETDVNRQVIPVIRGDIADLRTAAGEIPFKNLTLLPTNEALVPGNPDFYYGARPEQLDYRIREELGRFIIPSTQHDRPIVPNHTTAVKGPEGSGAVVKRQAMHEGYLAARAINALQTYGRAEPYYDGNAHAFSSTYLDGRLALYVNYPVPSAEAGEGLSYYMHLLDDFTMRGRREKFVAAPTWYRNSIEMAKEMRDEAISKANKIVLRAPALPAVSNMRVNFVSTGSQVDVASLAKNRRATEDQLAGDSQDEEEEVQSESSRQNLAYPVKRSVRSHEQGELPSKRQNRGALDDTASTATSSEGTTQQT